MLIDLDSNQIRLSLELHVLYCAELCCCVCMCVLYISQSFITVEHLEAA